MYKVVIVDDEPIIVEGLKNTIPWSNWDCEVIGTAEDGQEGIRVVAENKPDIIISDICMPEMDGLAMIAALKSEYPEMEVSILTGFRDFDYAQKAIRLGVTRFLLKPSKLDEIEEAIMAMVNNIEEKHKKKQILTSLAHIAPEETIAEAQETEAESEDENGEESVAGSFVVNNAIKYIEENYMVKIKLNDVADHVYVSQWHLSKLLNRYTGQSFSDVLNNVRIEKAKELLKDPSLRIGDIADMVGFLDMAHFSRVFKKQTGISANEYRNGKL